MAEDAVAGLMERIREYGYVCRFPTTNGGPEAEAWNLEILELELTALAQERDAAVERVAAMRQAAEWARDLIAEDQYQARAQNYRATYEVDQPWYDVLKALDAATAPPEGE